MIAAVGAAARSSCSRTALAQGGVQLLPKATPAPVAEVAIDGLPRREVMRHQPPGTTTAQDVEDQRFSAPRASRRCDAGPPFLRWDKGDQKFPADIAEIGIIGLAVHGQAFLLRWDSETRLNADQDTENHQNVKCATSYQFYFQNTLLGQ